MQTLTTGMLARRAGVNIETIRYYERKGLLPMPPRRESGYRQYPLEAVQRIRFIKRAQGLGFSLREIADLLNLRVEPHRSCDEVRKQAEGKIRDIEDKIRDLQQMVRALKQLAASCSHSGAQDDCPLLAYLEESAP